MLTLRDNLYLTWKGEKHENVKVNVVLRNTYHISKNSFHISHFWTKQRKKFQNVDVYTDN